jgi:hypothetical protein
MTISKAMRRIGLCAALLACAVEGALAANPSISSASTPSTVTYTLDDSAYTKGTIVIKSNGYKGDFFVTLTYKSISASTTNKGDALSYGFYKDEALTTALDTTGSTSGTVLSGTFSSTATSSTTSSLYYYFAVSPDALPGTSSSSAITFTIKLTVTLYAGTASSYTKISTTKTLSVKAKVSGCISASLSSGTLDLGKLPAFESDDAVTSSKVALGVVSNKAYTMSFSSTNSGYLKSSEDNSIGYTLYYATDSSSSGSAVSWSTSLSETATYAMDNNKATFYLSVVVPSGFKMEGTYTDTVTITVAQ